MKITFEIDNDQDAQTIQNALSEAYRNAVDRAATCRKPPYGLEPAEAAAKRFDQDAAVITKAFEQVALARKRLADGGWSNMPIMYVSDNGFWPSGSYTVVEFWPYTSYVTERIVEFKHKLGGDTEHEAFKRHLLQKAKDDGLDYAYSDNKIVFGLECEGRKFYIGFYDGQMAIGTGFRTDDYNIQAAKRRAEGKNPP